MPKLIYFICAVFIGLIGGARAQYLDSSGSNAFINQYVSENEDNWNKSIIFVFYSNQMCGTCARTMGMIYNVYMQNYSNEYSYFEINYSNEDEYQFRMDYDLMTPLSIVLVKVNDGMARDYYKIDNPQFWSVDANFFNNRLTTLINNFFN